MALTANEKQRSAVPVQDLDGRLIVVGPDGVPIGGGGGGADPLSDGVPGGALPTRTLWVAGADGAVLRGLVVDSSSRLRTVVEGTPAVSVSNFPASQAVTGPLTDAQLRAAAVPVSGPVTDAQLRASAVPVSGPLTDAQLRAAVVPVGDGAGSLTVDSGQLPAALDADGGMKVHVQNPSAGGGGVSQQDKTAFTEGTTVFAPTGGVFNDTITADPTEDQAAAARITPKRAVHSNLRNQAGTEIATATNPVRTDPTGSTTQPVSGTVTSNLAAGTNNIGDVDVLTLPSLPAGAAIIGKVDINSAPQVAVNNVETLADNAGFTDGTSKLFPSGFIFDESAGTALTENDVAAARIDTKRALVNVIEDATTRGRRAIVSATGGLLGDQGAPAAQANAWFTRPRKLVTYRAVYKAAASIYQLTFTQVANTRKQWCTIHHAVGATKTVKLRNVIFFVTGHNAAALTVIELVRITTAPATGNPVITPSKASSGDGAVEATCLALPTTQATEEAQVYSFNTINAGVFAASTTPYLTQVPAFDLLQPNGSYDDESKLPEIRAGVAEGWAITITSSGAPAVAGFALIEFTEE